MNEITHQVELPEGSVPLSVVEVVEFLDEDGKRRYVVRSVGTDSTAMCLGLLELAKQQIYDGSTFDDD